MPTVKLDQRRVDALKHRKSVYDVRDRDLKGFGLRVWPSGKKTLLRPQPARGQAHLEDHCQRREHERR